VKAHPARRAAQAGVAAISFACSAGSVAPSVPSSSTRLLSESSKAVRPNASRPASSSAASPATALSPATIRGVRLSSARMQSIAAASGTET